MANGRQIDVNLAFNADTSKVKRQLEDLQKQLTQLMSTGSSNKQFTFSKDIDEATRSVAKLKAQLEAATNVKTGKLDLGLLNQSFKQAGTSLEQYRVSLQKLGPDGEAAFRNLASSILKAEVPLKQSNTLLKDFATTLKNTAKWQISSAMIHGFMGSIQTAYYYAEDLNESLNNIRIVTGQSVEQMAQFAQEANKAAKALSTTTTDYANASLIYYQQGLSDEEVKQRTDITIKMANVARESAEDVSQQMTAVWNNFDDGSKSLEHYADVMTALGAATASSTDEIAEGLEKFAAVADTVGLSYEYATSALATVTAQTRQSADVVGNAFKTIFARMEGLQLGKTLEDGVDLNKYSAALAAIGVSIKDVNGELKSMDQILDETGERWATLSKEQQVATAQTVAGVRQYTQFAALFDNWDFFKQNLNVANNATGALQEQADIYAESWEAAQKRVRASLETIWQELINDDFFIDLNNAVAKFVDQLSNVIKGIGGVQGALALLGNAVTHIFAQDMSVGINKFIYNLQDAQKVASSVRESAMNGLYAVASDSDVGVAYEHILQLQQAYLDNAENMNAVERQAAQIILDEQESRAQNLIQLIRERKELESVLTLEQRRATITATKHGANGDEVANVKSAMAGLEAITAEAIKTKEAVDHCFDALEKDGTVEEKLNLVREAFQNISVEGLNVSDEIKNAFDTIKNSTANTDEEINKVSQALQTLFASTDAWGTEVAMDAKILEELELALIDTGMTEEEITATIEKLTAATDNYAIANRKVIQTETEMGKSTEAAKQAMEKQGKINLSAGQSMVKLANGLTSVVFALQSFKGIINTLNNEDLSFFDKFLSITMSLGMSIPMLINGIPALITGFKSLGAALSGVAIEGAAAQVALWPLVAIIAAIAAVVGVTALAVNSYIDAQNKAANAAKDAKAEAERLTTQYQELSTAAKEFKDAVSGYEEAITSLEDLDKSTDKYKETLKNANEQARKLIETYKLFGQYKIENGVIKIDPQSLKQIQQLKNSQLADVNSRQYAQNIISNSAELNSQLVTLSRSIGAVTENYDLVSKKMTKTFFDENDLQKTAQVMGEIYEAGGKVKLSEEEWSKQLQKHSSELTPLVADNIDLISKNATRLLDFKTSLDEAAEANKYYAKEILGIKVEEESGEHIAKASKDKEGNVDEVTYDELVALVSEKYRKVDEDNIQKALKEADNVEPIEDRKQFMDKYKDLFEGLTDDYESIYRTWAKEVQGLSEEEAKNLQYISKGFGRAKLMRGNENLTSELDFKDIIKQLSRVGAQKKAVQGISQETSKEKTDTYIKAVENITNKLDKYANRLGVNPSSSFRKNLADLDKLESQNFDFSDIFSKIGPKAKDEFKNEMLDLAKDDEFAQTFQVIFGKTFNKDTWKLMIDSAFDKYDPTQYQENVKSNVHGVASSINNVMNQVSSGELTSDNAFTEDKKSEELNNLIIQLNQLREEYPKLEEEIDIINNKWLVGTEDYIIALGKVREQMQMRDLAESAKQQIEDIDSLLEKFSDGTTIKVGADPREFEDAIAKIVKDDYSIDIQVHTAMEGEFDTITSAFNNIHDMAAKIGDDFKVAASDLRALNNTFPGILEGMKTLKDGSVQLDKEMVQSAMQGAEAEAQADAQAKIQKLQNAAVLVREKQRLYEQMAQDALTLANAETETEEGAKNARASIVKTLSAIRTKDEQLASESVMGNAKDVADNSKVNAGIVASNYSKSAQSMAQSYYNAAKNMIENMNQVTVASQGGGGAAVPPPKIDPNYQGEEGQQGQTDNTYEGGKSNEDQVDDLLNESLDESRDKWKKVHDLYKNLAKEANNTATDIEGMVAQIGASAHALDTALGGVAKGLGADNKKDKKGGGKKEKDPDKKDKLKDELDRYFDINNAIAQINNSLTKNEQIQKRLSALQNHYFGNALAKSLKEQNELLKKRNDILEQQYANYEKLYEMQKQELAELKTKIGGLWEGDVLQNYSQLFQANLDKYNAVIEKYNAMTKEQQEKTGKLMLEQAKKVYEEYKKNLERYQKLYYNEMLNTENKLEEMRQQQLENQLKIIENNLKAYEAKIKIKLDKTKLKREWNEFIKEAQDDFRKVFSDLSLDSKLRKDNFGEYEKDVDERIKQIQDVENEIDKMEKAKNKKGEVVLDDDFMFGSISEAQEKLKELQSELVEAGKNLRELYKQVWDNYIKGLEQAAQGFENINGEFEHINKNLEYEKELIELVYGDKAYNLMGKYYETQQKNITNQIDSTRQQADFWQDQLNKAYEMNKDKHGVKMDDMSTWTEDMKKAYEEMIKSQEKLNDLVIEGIKNLQDKYLNGVRKATENAQKQMFGGKTLEEVRKEWDKSKKQSDLYLDDTDKLYEITTLSNKINKSIKEYANNTKVQQKLNKLRDDELKQLREKEKLTKYDIQLAEQRYQIALKELEIENAQENKNAMKLTRDESGNWTYQYVADEQEVENKKQELLDLIEQLRQIAEEGETAMEDLWLEAWEDYWERYQEIAENTTLSEEEKLAKIKELNEEMWPEIEEYGDLAQRYQQEAIAATASEIALACDQEKANYENLTNTQKQLVDAVKEHHLLTYEEIRQAVVGDYDDMKNKGTEDFSDLKKAAEDTYKETNQLSKTTVGQIIKDWDDQNSKSSFKGAMTDAYNEVQKLTKNYEKELEELEKVSGRNIMDPGGVVDDLEHIGEQTDEVNNKTDDMVDNATNRLDELRDFVNEVEAAWDAVIDKIQDAIDKLQDYIDKMSEAKSVGKSSKKSGSSSGGSSEPPSADIPAPGDGSGGGSGSGSGGSKKKKNKASETWSITGHGEERHSSTAFGAVVELTSSLGNQDQKYFVIPKRGRNVGIAELDAAFREKYRKKYPGLRTGGYTGDWGDDSGRLAVLHKKELVLNASDTKNMLQMVNTVRDMASLNNSISQMITDSVGKIIAKTISTAGLGNYNSNTDNSQSTNVFNVTAEFPNANDVETIKDAILSLPNIVSQYIHQK